MTDSAPDTHGLQDQPDPPVLAASVVGAVRTENAGCKHGDPEDAAYWHAWQEGRAYGWEESHRGRVWQAWKHLQRKLAR